MTRPIALVGLMGAGKSAVARALAALGCVVVDLDREIERAAGVTIAELFAARGEAALRDLEAAALGRALEAGAQVVDCGGGVVERTENRAMLVERCRTVWLEVAPAEAARRLRGSPEGTAARPLLAAGSDAATRLAELLARRAAWYEDVAELRIDTEGSDPRQIAEEIVTRLEAPHDARD